MKTAKLHFSHKTIITFLFLILLKKFYYFLNDLSHYFPFSILFQRYNFHHSKEDISLAHDIILDQVIKNRLEIKFLLETQDNYFVYVLLTLPHITEKKIANFRTDLQKLIGESNVYVVQKNNTIWQIHIARGSLTRKMNLLLNAF